MLEELVDDELVELLDVLDELVELDDDELEEASPSYNANSKNIGLVFVHADEVHVSEVSVAIR